MKLCSESQPRHVHLPFACYVAQEMRETPLYISVYTKARLSLVHQVERLTEAYLVGILPREEYKRRRQELEQKQAALANQVRQIEVSVKQQFELPGVAKSMEEFCQRVSQGLEQASFEQKWQLVELFVDRIIVTGEEGEIRYVIPTSVKRSVSSFLTKGYNIAVRALYKPFERRQKSALRLHASCLPWIANTLHKLPEKPLLYLFVKKLLTSLYLGEGAIRSITQPQLPSEKDCYA